MIEFGSKVCSFLFFSIIFFRIENKEKIVDAENQIKISKKKNNHYRLKSIMIMTTINAANPDQAPKE
jgi:hypothetical protein